MVVHGLTLVSGRTYVEAQKLGGRHSRHRAHGLVQLTIASPLIPIGATCIGDIWQEVSVGIEAPGACPEPGLLVLHHFQSTWSSEWFHAAYLANHRPKADHRRTRQ